MDNFLCRFLNHSPQECYANCVEVHLEARLRSDMLYCFIINGTSQTQDAIS